MAYRDTDRAKQKEKERLANRYASMTPEQRQVALNRTREWYRQNSKRVIEKNKATKAARIKELQRIVNELKTGPCVDCENSFDPIAMDFDHVRGKKLFSISTAIIKVTALSKILSEIEKCELVCSNCHRVRTAIRRVT
jgi:5-methylcytosine-specific restriction endonuclease McrA